MTLPIEPVTPDTTARAIAAFLQLELLGPDLHVRRPYALHDCQPGGVTFAKGTTTDVFQIASRLDDCLVICQPDLAMSLSGSRIASPDPRLTFVLMMEQFFAPKRPTGIHPTAIIHPSARVGRNASIGAHCWIGEQVVIGDDCVIYHNVVVEGPTTIGSNCRIKSNTVIGEEGFNFCMDEHGIPHHFPHVGRIRIGDYVWIGANSSIEQAVLSDTVVEDHVKIDDHVQVGHNTRIGRSTRIAAASIVCGGAVVGPGCWLAPNVTILESRTIGHDSILGMGAVVLRDVPANSVVVGNPGRRLRDNVSPQSRIAQRS
jgi:UDP-3-O-[3-hydroxymyristoyl] glucosamine N-acyltransferase